MFTELLKDIKAACTAEDFAALLVATDVQEYETKVSQELQRSFILEHAKEKGFVL